MSYEKGESLEDYRDRSSDAERNRIIEQLQSLCEPDTRDYRGLHWRS